MPAFKAHASPTKDFFVRMITKDISLEDCILDLIDNCLDGARKVKYAANGAAVIDSYAGFRAAIEFSGQRFSIKDNCGGISISEAIDYAFHFGRRSNAPSEAEYSIGLYGIGMKRAIFKIGNVIEIYSSTQTEAFRSLIKVNEWLTQTRVLVPGQPAQDDWDFDMDDAPADPDTGTSIVITELRPEIGSQFIQEKFASGLARIVGRDYSQFIAKDFQISINSNKVERFHFTVRESKDFKPVRLTYTDETGVEVEIIAGMSGLPPTDLQATDNRPETDYYGWFVLCNDRVVLASDKGNHTVWGDNGFQTWHYQYNGFIGVVSFHAKNPNLLPWTTTKRDVDGTNAVYRRAIEKMKDVTRPWIKYTNERRGDLDAARQREAAATSRPLFDVALNPTLQVPKVTASPKVAMSSIQYLKSVSEIAKAKKLLKNASMPNYRVGELTFDYFMKNESED